MVDLWKGVLLIVIYQLHNCLHVQICKIIDQYYFLINVFILVKLPVIIFEANTNCALKTNYSDK